MPDTGSFLTPDARAELSHLTGEKPLAAWLVRERQSLLARWRPDRGGRPWMHDHAALLDLFVRRLYAVSAERSGTDAGAGGVAILAVGGYGQRLLAPHSDLDLTFLSARDDDPPLLRQMFTLVMGVLLSGAKMKVGYAYRTLADFAGDTLDHQTQTALLDARLLAGDSGLFAQFEQTFPDHLPVADFLFRKEAERARVRAKWGGTPFVVEPNVKEGAGGLRDLQTAAWMARVRYGKAGEALWRDLVHRKVITKDDLHTLAQARDLLLTLRCVVHTVAGERRDILNTRRQEEIAARLGYPAVGDDGLPGVETLMRRYYDAAAALYRISDKVMARCLDAPLPLGAETGLSSVRRLVTVTDPARAHADPLWPLHALRYCQEHTLEFALPTDEAVAHHVAGGGLGEADSPSRREAGRLFLELLTAPGDPVLTLRRMLRTGLLAALLPELANCMGLIPYDSAHTFTIGEHSIRVLNNLVTLRDRTGENDPALSGYQALLKSLAAPQALFLAALLHDVGKQWPALLSGTPSAHEATGAERVGQICERLGCSGETTRQTQFLVRHHLLLSQTSRLRDLAQPATIRETARLIDDRETLRALYLLTWADANAVAPGIWTDMTARLLDELFARTDDWLDARNNADPPPDAAIRDGQLDSVRERLHRQLTLDTRPPGRADTAPFAGADPDAVRAHVRLMPAAYLLNTPPETIALHLHMITRLRAGEGVVVDMRRDAPGSSQTEMTVLTRDAPGLFARLTGALFGCGIGLHRAQAFTRPVSDDENADPSDAVAIDTLTVDYRDRPLSGDKRREAADALRRVLGDEETVAHLLSHQRRGAGGDVGDTIPVRSLLVDNDSAPDFTLIDIEASDRIGTTYRLADRFAGFGWNIHAARVTTWGGMARCAFYLTDRAGQSLDPDTVRARLTPVIALPDAPKETPL